MSTGSLRLLWPIWAGLVLVVWAAVHWPLVTAGALWPAGIGAALRDRAFGLAPPLALLPLVAAGVLALAGAGARLTSALGAAPCGPVETLAYAVALGLGAFATAGAVLGLAGAFTRAGLTAAAALGLLAGWLGPRPGGGVPSALRSLLRAAQAQAGLAAAPPTCATPDGAPAEPAGPWAALGMLVAAVALAIGFVKACAPPWYPDALFYHLALPRLYLDAGAFVAVPQEPINAAHPGLAQVLFALPMAWGHDELTGVLSWVLLAVAVAGAGLLAQATGGPGAGALAVAAVAGVPHLAFVGSVPLADGALLAYATLGMHATVRAAQADDAGWARVASLCAGLALATKYQGLAPLGLVAVALVAAFARARGVVGMLRVALPAAALAVLPFLPWAARNVRFYGCPLAPLIAGHEDGPARALLAQYRADWATHGHRVSALRLPFDATFFADPDDLAGYEGEAGPLALALAPLCVLAVVRRRPLALALALYVGVQGLFWTWGARELRYLFPLAPAYFALALGAVRTRAAFAAVAPVVVLGAALGTAWLAGYARPAAELCWLCGGESRASYYATLTATRPLALACATLAREPGARALFFWEDRGYLCPVPYRADHLVPASTSHVLHALPEEPGALASRLRALGVTHLLVNRQAWDEARRRGIEWTFSAPLARFLAGSAVKAVPGLGPAEGAAIELWRLQEPLSAPPR